MNPNQLFADVLAEELQAIDLRRAHARHGRAAVPDALAAVEALPWGGAIPAAPGETEAQKLEREDLNQARREQAMRREALDRDLVGLALSGGGIRSATFSLGLLQGLARMNLLKRVDYLSTVSGGGYIGSWLAAWIRREGAPPVAPIPDPNSPTPDMASKDAVLNVERQLNPSRVAQQNVQRPVSPVLKAVDEEPEAIRHLRSYSNYLTPRPGLFTTDTWTLIAIYVRNFLFNQLILLPFAVAFVLLVWMVVLLFGPHRIWENDLGGATFLVLLAWSFLLIGLELSKLYRSRTAFDEVPPAWMLKVVKWRVVRGMFRSFSPTDFYVYIVVPLILDAVLATWLFGVSEVHGEKVFNWRALADLVNGYKASTGGQGAKSWGVDGSFSRGQAMAFVVGFGLLHMVAHTLGMIFGLAVDAARIRTARGWRTRLGRDGMVLIASFASGAFGGLLFYVMMVKFLIPGFDAPGRLATFGPPLALLLLAVAAFTEVGLLGRVLQEDEREWWSRVTAILMTTALAWVVIFGTIVYVPPVVSWLEAYAHGALKPGLVLGWLATSFGGAMAGRSEKTGEGGLGKALGLLAKVAPFVFLLGLLATVSWVLWHEGLGLKPPAPGLAAKAPAWFTEAVYAQRVDPSVLLLAFAVFLGLGIVTNALLNVNLFSLHAMYANRLARCYLGASRRKEEWGSTWRNGVWHPGLGGAPTGSGGPCRSGQLLTGFDFHDDLPLRDLKIGPPIKRREGDAGYWGPLRLINTSMNLVSGQELALQDRRAESFVLSPLYCGSKGTGYRRLDEASDDVLTVGRAMAISGAAVDPSLGAAQSPALTALMTIFNARLGWWLQNPKSQADWTAASPRFARLLWYELAGRTDENGEYVHLSDGGHFENLGVYELIRRRCRYIIACDAGEDHSSIYADLATLARLCRSDFGIRIEIDTSPIDPVGTTRHGRWHCAIGQVHYEDVDPEEIPGVLIYVKASITGDEPSDVRNYAATNPDFPHQTTADQFFDEPQFESYRALGHHVAASILNAAVYDAGLMEVAQTPPPPGLDPEAVRKAVRQLCKRENRSLFSRLRARWFPAPPELEATYQDTARSFGILQGVMRDDPTLRAFSHDLNPELGPAHPRLNGKAHGPVNGHKAPAASAKPPGPGPGATRDDRRSAELHMVNQVVQVMEKAWMGVRLEGYPEHPINRGWMNALRRVARSKTLRRNWPIIRGGFDLEFVQFCERELGVPDGSPTAFPLSRDGAGKLVLATDSGPRCAARALRVLGEEFAREWPGQEPLSHWIDLAIPTGGVSRCYPCALALADGLPTAWLVGSTRWDEKAHRPRPTFAIGVVLAWAHSSSEAEVMVWLRGPFRGMGVGRECFAARPGEPGLLDPLARSLKAMGMERVRAYYPATDPASRIIERKLWLNFHYSHEFRVRGRVEVESGQEQVMTFRLA